MSSGTLFSKCYLLVNLGTLFDKVIVEENYTPPDIKDNTHESRIQKTAVIKEINSDTSLNDPSILKEKISTSNKEPEQQNKSTIAEIESPGEISQVNENKESKIIKNKIPVNKANACANVNIAASFKSTPSCLSYASGSISVIETSLYGGTWPFDISLNGGRVFKSNHVFTGLDVGNYQVMIRDGNKCYKKFNITVATKDCSEIIEEGFSPDRGERWKIPVRHTEYGQLKISNNEGNIIYQVNIIAGTPNSWRGQDLNNALLPHGSYPFTIELRNGEIRSGLIHIVP